MKATIDDLEELIRTRIIVLRAVNQLADDVDMTAVEEQSRAYYQKALCDGTHTAYLVYDGDKFVGAGGISISYYQIMPMYRNVTGMKAYIMNMYTHPDHRRMGIAYGTVKRLVEDAKGKGFRAVTLEATPMGRLLYEKLGFCDTEDEMILRLD